MVSVKSLGQVRKSAVLAKRLLWCLPLVGLVAVAGAAPPATPKAEADFDKEVRANFFTGFRGDAAALAKGMAACETMLKEKPEHPQALVWHGSGLIFTAGQQFSKGDVNNGIKSWMTSIKEMDKAVALAPNEVAVRVPRGAAMTAASRFAPKDQQAMLLSRALSDFETVYKQQEKKLAALSPHSRGELLMGLAENYLRSGEREKGKAVLKQVQLLCPDTAYATEATQWLAADKGAKYFHQCVGCHEG